MAPVGHIYITGYVTECPVVLPGFATGLFEKITSSRYIHLGGAPNVSEGPIFTLWRAHISFKKMKFRQISRGVQILQYNKFWGSIFFEKLVPGGNQFWGVHFCHDRHPWRSYTYFYILHKVSCIQIYS